MRKLCALAQGSPAYAVIYSKTPAACNYSLLSFTEYFVDKSVFHSLVGGQIIVSVGVVFYLSERFARIFGKYFVEFAFGF